jgi:hypothetical protein
MEASWLEVRCARCKTPSDVDLAAMKHPPTAFVHDLVSRLRCRKCAKAGRRPSATLLQLAWQAPPPSNRSLTDVQSLFDHDKPGRHQRAVSRREPIRWQSGADAGDFPDYKAPIVRNEAEGRELARARWGMPSSQHALMEATKKRAAKLEAKVNPSSISRNCCGWSRTAAPLTSAT